MQLFKSSRNKTLAALAAAGERHLNSIAGSELLTADSALRELSIYTVVVVEFAGMGSLLEVSSVPI